MNDSSAGGCTLCASFDATTASIDDDDDDDDSIPEWIDPEDVVVDNDSIISGHHHQAAEAAVISDKDNSSSVDMMLLLSEAASVLNSSSSASCASSSNTTTTSSNRKSCVVLETFSEDVSALILSHLSIEEISVVSQVSKSLYRASRSHSLWKILFHVRWNISTAILVGGENDDDDDDDDSHKSSNTIGVTTRSSSGSYFRAYQQAHLHPHDLWITHWNCSFAADGVTPGRCCIRPRGGDCSSSSSKRKPRRRNDESVKESDSDDSAAVDDHHHHGVVEENEAHRESKCPACRCDLNLFHNNDSSSKVSLLNKHDNVAAATATKRNNNKKKKKNQIHTPIRSMAAQTRCLHRQLMRILNSHSGHDKHARQQQQQQQQQQHSSTTSSRRAFECAATFHRRLDTRQYEQPGLTTHFLTDLLFFNLSDPTCIDGQWELEQLVHEVKLQQEHESFLQQEDNNNAIFFFEHARANNPLPPRPPPAPSLSLLQQQHETAHHSWHVLELTNPDWYRPILYQFFVQRPDCFTIYPSQGLIEAGQKAFVTVGVRPLGSALAHAFEALNVHRDGLVDDDVHDDGNKNVSNSALWADLYTEQAHLPLVPFVVRYRFAMAPPESNVYFGSGQDYAQQQQHLGRQFMGDDDGDDDNDNFITNHSQRRRGHDYKTKQAAMLDYHWKQNVPTCQMRSIHLSAHVHAHYSFLDFFDKTCSPWDFERDVTSSNTTTTSIDEGPIFLAPNLRELYPQVYSKAVAMTQNHISKIPKRTTTSSSSLTTDYSPSLVRTTEGPCSECGQLWGCREEECMQIFIMDKAKSLVHVAKRRLLMQNIRTCIQAVGRLSCLLNDSQVARLCTLLCAVFSTIQAVKAAPWATFRQKKILVAWEQIVDDYFCQISQVVKGKADWYPWRLSGTFKYALCTESVFGGPVICDNGIDEPKYLNPYRHLTHSPGFFCLGRQEDANHDEQSNAMLSASCARYVKKKTGFGTTDIFMDHPISALQAGFCMVQDPRSLLVHGLYDSIEYPGTIVRRPRIPLLHSIVDSRDGDNPTTTIDICYNLSNYSHGTPPPGVGRFALTKSVASTNGGSPTVVEVNVQDVDEVYALGVHKNRRIHLPHRDPPVENLRGLQFVQRLWALGAQLGLAVRPDGAPVFVDRKILIACQWMAISIMIGPLLVTLVARFAFRMPSQPVEYNLEGFPFEFSSKLRFLTEVECGYVSLLLVVSWFALGRWTERHTDRDFFRVMQEHTLPISSSSSRQEKNCLAVINARVQQFVQRQWDAIYPLFLQRQVFSPSWNRRSHEDFFKHIACWRSRGSHRSPVVRAAAGRAWNTMFGDCRDLGIVVGTVSSTRKLMVAIMVVLGSFCSSTPHFWLNLLTVFACSISLGMSVSLHSIEKGRSAPVASWNTTGSMLAESNLLTIVITSFLVGQIVGSSGGIMFLAEFVVTAVSLILGAGAATISASAMESWGCLFCLSSTAFWGYLVARVAIVDGVRNKRMGYTSFLLSSCIGLLCLFWVSVLMMPFYSHVSLIIQQPDDKEIRSWTRKFAEKKLQ